MLENVADKIKRLNKNTDLLTSKIINTLTYPVLNPI